MSMIDCINTREKNRRIKRYEDSVELAFFEKVLMKYVPYINDSKYQNNQGEIILNEDDQTYFSALKENYEYVAKTAAADDWGSSDELSHTFALYVSVGLIILKNGIFSINKNELLKKMDEYNEYQKLKRTSFEDEQMDNGIQYTISKK